MSDEKKSNAEPVQVKDEAHAWIRVELADRGETMTQVGVRVERSRFLAIGWVPNEHLRPCSETATSDAVLELRSAMCGRCGAIGGTHGRPCIDDSAFMAQLEEWGLKVRATREKGEAGR